MGFFPPTMSIISQNREHFTHVIISEPRTELWLILVLREHTHIIVSGCVSYFFFHMGVFLVQGMAECNLRNLQRAKLLISWPRAKWSSYTFWQRFDRVAPWVRKEAFWYMINLEEDLTWLLLLFFFKKKRRKKKSYQNEVGFDWPSVSYIQTKREYKS